MGKLVYNLEFPRNVESFSIGGYIFTRAHDYKDKYKKLSHSINSSMASVNSGSNELTGHVESADMYQPAVLEWGYRASALDDIMLLISLATRRNAFTLDALPDGNTVIIADPRRHAFGGLLRCSIKWDAEDTGGSDAWGPDGSGPRDVGFERVLNEVYTRVISPEWLARYRHGYFLMLALAAFSIYNPSIAYVQCWTMWEHLFASLTDSWLSDAANRRMSSDEKLAYVLVQNNMIKNVGKGARENIKKFATIRNGIVHAGKFPQQEDVLKHVQLFIELTECIIIKILGLEPSNVKNTKEHFDLFIDGKKQPPSLEEVMDAANRG